MHEDRMKIGYALCGSFCTHKQSMETLTMLAEHYTVIPILSDVTYRTDTRFGNANALISRLTEICHCAPIHTIPDAEPLGPAVPLDLLVIAPCTGNTLAKLANGVTDTSVTMAAKAHLRSDRPLVVALASNDAMSANLRNIGALLNRKHVYFVPMRQDDVRKKPHSLVADFAQIPAAIASALRGEQMRPLFLT